MRAYVDPHQDDWDEHLVTVEFAYNDSVNMSTGYTPFYLNHGHHPITPLTMFLKTRSDESSSSTEPVEAFAARLREDVNHARDALLAAQQRQAYYADRSRRHHAFKVGDKVWLSAAHLRLPATQNARRQLQPCFYGPHKVVEVASPVAVRLQLPPSFKIHPVIHVSHLKTEVDGTQQFPDRPEYAAPPPPEVIDGEEHYLVESFRGHSTTQ